jgi:hypothetical protein
MQATELRGRTTATVQGTLQEIDLLAREMRVRVDGLLVAFAVPPTCAVWLHEERVKLRLLQPQDCVEVAHTVIGDRQIALCVRVI